MAGCMIDDNVLAYGFLDGNVPFAGTFRDGDIDREISGNLQWQTMLPDSSPDEGMLDVYMAMFMDSGVSGYPLGARMRLRSDFVSQLIAKNAEAGGKLLDMFMSGAGKADLFVIQHVR